MPEKEFEGRNALITGGSRGIGRAVALTLARKGANVAINYLSRDQEALETKEMIEKEGAKCVLAKGDVSDPEAVRQMAARAREGLGTIGLLVNNAGYSVLESHNEITFESWKKTMAINLDGCFLPTMAIKDEMLAQRWGRIVNVSSVAALRPRKLQIHYASSKAALMAMTRCCAEAFAPDVRVNCVAPGLVKTEMGDTIPPETAKKIIADTPVARLGEPEDISDVICFLLSDASRFMTGQTIAVSGGRVMLPS